MCVPGYWKYAMIYLLGSPESNEHAHAAHMRDLIAAEWGKLADDQRNHVWLVVGAKCYGQDVQDLDLVLFAYLPDSHLFPAPPYEGKDVYVQSLCLVIEIKQHPRDRIEFEGSRLYVRYANRVGRHDASEQSHRQRYALKGYIERHGIESPYIVNLLWLPNVPTAALPTMTHNVLGSDLTWQGVLAHLQALNAPWYNPHAQQHQMRAGKSRDEGYFSQAVALLTRELAYTPLDRRRVETITHEKLADQQYTDKLGSQLLIFQGRGGTGKTVRLLQLANYCYRQRDARVLILSYNVALVADIRRTLQLMGIREGIEDKSIVIKTWHSFMGKLLKQLGVQTAQGTAFYKHYPHYLAEANALLQGFAPTERLAVLNDGAQADFAWDFVLVDEAQDCPPAERDLLATLYGAERLVIADGMDQFVRGQQKTPWRDIAPRSRRQIVTLSKSLRLKGGLARFALAVAQHLDLTEWNIEPESDLYGGHIIVLTGAYTAERHAALLATHSERGNKPVDMLFCVPPSTVDRDQSPASAIGRDLAAWGYAVWDATDDHTRHTYPTTVEEHRIVQYASCRGLEGWTVVNMGLDELYDHQATEYEPDPAEHELLDVAAERHRHAARWLMIPLTRAIDTLVIHLHDPQHAAADILRAAAAACGDSINLEWSEACAPPPSSATN